MSARPNAIEPALRGFLARRVAASGVARRRAAGRKPRSRPRSPTPTPRYLVPAILLSAATLACSLVGRVAPNPTALPATQPLADSGQPGMPSPTPPLAGEATPTTAARAPAGPLCADPAPPLVTNLDVFQTPPLAEPAARVPFRDPTFGACVVRVTDREHDLDAGDESLGLKNEYSRVQAFNADQSRLLARGINATWYLYDARTLERLARLPIGGSVDPRWDAADPNRLYYSDGTRLMQLDTPTGEQSVVHDFAADFPGEALAAVWSKYEGSPSRDGRYWGFMVEDENWETIGLVVYDQQADQVIARRDMRGVPGIESVDNAYISPLGNYFIADFSDYFCERGQMGTDAVPCGYMVYDRELSTGRGLMRISGHQDLALDADGREVAVFQDIDTDLITMLDLATGAITPLAAIDFSHTSIGLHISGRAFDRPGWVVVSTHDGDSGAYTWMDDQVFLLELKAGGRVVRLAHTHSLVDENQEHDYWAEPHASANRDLTRIVFTSNWGRSGTEEVEMFLIDLPPDWPARLP